MITLVFVIALMMSSVSFAESDNANPIEKLYCIAVANMATALQTEPTPDMMYVALESAQNDKVRKFYSDTYAWVIEYESNHQEIPVEKITEMYFINYRICKRDLLK